MRRLAEALGAWLLGLAYRAEDDPLAAFDNRRDTCPACGMLAERACPLDGMTHDPCLGHIEGARSACCGHGLGVGHVIIKGTP